MRRYVTLSAPIGQSWFDPPPQTSITVFEAEAAPQRTGLLDASGRPLYAVDEREPAAFVRFQGK